VNTLEIVAQAYLPSVKSAVACPTIDSNSTLAYYEVVVGL
jgi:hypothetical protein